MRLNFTILHHRGENQFQFIFKTKNIAVPGDQQVDQPGVVPGLRREQPGAQLLAPVQVLRLSVGRENQPECQLRALFRDRWWPFALHRVHCSGTLTFLLPLDIS